MGCFDYSCSVSGLPIGWETPVRFILLAQKCGLRPAIPHDVGGRWQPLAPPIRARYNSYGSVEFRKAREVEVLFEILDRRGIAQKDVRETRGMSQGDWLSALWLGQVVIETPRGKAEVAQTMVREDVWLYLLENHGMSPSEPPSWRFIDSSMRQETAIETEVIGDPTLEASLRELYGVALALKCLGRPWTPGTCCGPQDGLWDLHKRFAEKVASIAAFEIDKYQE